MSMPDILLIVVIALCVAAALFAVFRRRGRHCGCGRCSGCGLCSQKSETNKEERG